MAEKYVFSVDRIEETQPCALQWRLKMYDGNIHLMARRPGITGWLSVVTILHGTGEARLSKHMGVLHLPMCNGRIALQGETGFMEILRT